MRKGLPPNPSRQELLLTLFRRMALRVYPRCQWCRIRLRYRTATVDHIRPTCRGGLDELKNYCLSCRTCNFRKGFRWHEGMRPTYGPINWEHEFINWRRNLELFGTL